ncbi:MAG: hypothetical protein HQK98_04740 [Nitrospirae bacterium]|nr:hypothetical protein [Nitrospirota bacterium]
MAPGEKGAVVMDVLCDSAPGRVVKTVEVWSNDEQNRMITLVLEGDITQ